MIDHPLTVIPVASFPRAFLPISWLSGSTPRIFSTHSPENLTRAIGLGVVMVAKVEGEKSMVIMERVDDHVYSMCSLRKDLKIKDIRYVAKTSRDNDIKLEVKALNAAAMPVDGSEWWTSMTVQTLPSDINRQIFLEFLHRETPSIPSLVSYLKVANFRASEEMAVDTPTSEGLFSRHDSEFSADSGYISSNESLSNPVHTIKSQYLESLYSTKTSLAYFAKSALSRARSEYTAGDKSLNSVLSHLILKGGQFNLKYETAIPKFINDDSISSDFIAEEERRYLARKFSRKDDVDHRTTTQKEISDLKNREYLLLASKRS